MFQYACTTYQHELGEGVRGPGAAVRPLVVVSLPVRGVLHEAAPPGLNRGKILLSDSCDLKTFKNSLLNPSSLHVEWSTIVITGYINGSTTQLFYVAHKIFLYAQIVL